MSKYNKVSSSYADQPKHEKSYSQQRILPQVDIKKMNNEKEKQNLNLGNQN